MSGSWGLQAGHGQMVLCPLSLPQPLPTASPRPSQTTPTPPVQVDCPPWSFPGLWWGVPALTHSPWEVAALAGASVGRGRAVSSLPHSILLSCFHPALPVLSHCCCCCCSSSFSFSSFFFVLLSFLFLFSSFSLLSFFLFFFLSSSSFSFSFSLLFLLCLFLLSLSVSPSFPSALSSSQVICPDLSQPQSPYIVQG